MKSAEEWAREFMDKGDGAWDYEFYLGLVKLVQPDAHRAGKIEGLEEGVAAAVEEGNKYETEFILARLRGEIARIRGEEGECNATKEPSCDD